MGAYLSSPVTGKELYEGAKEGYLEYGGASMQVTPAPRCSMLCSWRLWPLPPGAAMALANYPQRARVNVHSFYDSCLQSFLFDMVCTCLAQSVLGAVAVERCLDA